MHMVCLNPYGFEDEINFPLHSSQTFLAKVKDKLLYKDNSFLYCNLKETTDMLE